MRRVALLLATLLASCAPTAREDHDAPVWSAALTHFIASERASGTLVIRTTSGGSLQTIAKRVEQDFVSDGLTAPPDAFADYIDLNSQKVTIPALSSLGIEVLYDDRFTLAWSASETLGIAVPIVLSLQRPGYSKDGAVAVLELSFNDGMHGGYARYVLTRESKALWRVAGHYIFHGV